MTQSFADMIYLFSCGTFGITPMLEHEIKIDAVYRHAVAQGVWPIVFLPITSLYQGSRLSIDNKIFSAYKYEAMVPIVNNTKRIFMIHKIIKILESNRVRCCVLKGEVLSYLYWNAGCRISTDTDILIDIKDKDIVSDIFKKIGFNVIPLSARSNHIVAKHKVAGVVEIHIELYSELYKDIWFDNKILNIEKYRTITTDDGTEISTLGITDGLIFITLHYIKHFLSRGVGIRQLMDVVLYMRQYYSQIDWERFDDLMAHLKYKKFIENSIGIGVKYLNFNVDGLPSFTCDENIMNKILYDIENGGVFGKNEDERSGFYLQYTKARFERFKHEDYSTYIKKWLRPNVINAIFPYVDNLSLKFPYVKKTPVLYPVAWIHRIIKLLISVCKKEVSVKRYINPEETIKDNETIKQRMDLIRELGMI